MIKTGIIGGTGLYQVEGIDIVDEKVVQTPFGEPSAPLSIGKFEGQEVVFLPRHGRHHEIMPSEINFRANIWALKSVGVEQIISVSATGSLAQEIPPGDFALASQYFDWTRGKRVNSFFGNGMVGHISTAKPACARLSGEIYSSAEAADIKLHRDKAYACVEGPRLGTRAESFFLKDHAKCDLVGMTNIPEAFLAREAQLCYCTIAIVTDYDCWLDDPSAHVSLAQVIQQYGKSLSKVQSLIKGFIKTGSLDRKSCQCAHATKNAVMTKPDHISPEKKEILDFLLK